jgi:hypothetical protein
VGGLSQKVDRKLFARPLERRGQDALADAAILLAHRLPCGTADGGAGFAGNGDLLPSGRRRSLLFGCGDLHFITVAQLRHQRHRPPVDARAGAMVAHIGVHRICKINRRRAARQSDDAALRREGENLVLKEFELGVFEKVFRAVALGQFINRLAEPGISPRFLEFALAAFRLAILVERVGGDAEFGHAVHRARAQLQLDALARRAENRGVQRLVVVRLRS